MDTFTSGLDLYLKSSVIMSLVAAFVGGVLASATPCVYPMIPITASYVSGSNLGGSRLRGFVLSVVYVLGVALTYAAMGVIAALTGRLFGEINTSPWSHIIVANVMIILGLGMLDVYTLPYLGPAGSSKPSGFVSVFFVGMASGLVAGPCTAPVLGVLLAYAASTQQILFAGVLLFVFALGMGCLLIVVGTFSSVVSSLPRSGEWMAVIKKVLGVIMIVIGQYFLVRAGQLIS